ncbi:ribulose-phosphate 3-epimerase [Nanoarchaeota archaeon]
MKKVIIPAIIAKTQKEFNEKINNVKNHVSLIQLDVMDGKFVENKSIDFNFKLPKTKCKYEAHLMIKNPEAWIKKHHKKVDTVLIHYQSTKNLPNALNLAKDKKLKVGIALNPEVKVSKIEPYLDYIDQVLILTVHPGAYGAKFLPKNLEKVKRLRKLKPKLNIEVDGGISPKTIKQVSKAGTNLFISGSYIVNAESVPKALKTLNSSMK